MRWIICVCLLALLGGFVACDLEPRPVERSTESSPSEANDPLVYRSRQTAFRLERALARLAEPMPAPNRFHEQACPDERIGRRVSRVSQATLSLASDDARYEAHSLLPLTLTRPLMTHEREQVEQFFSVGAETADSLMARTFKSKVDADAADEAARELEQRLYKGVFHVTLYKKAHLVRKKHKLHREWTRGILRAWLVVYDIDGSEPLCQKEIIAVNDVSEAPISIRLRARTQQRLVRALAYSVRSQAETTLASMSRVLRLPSSDLKGTFRTNAAKALASR